MLNRVDVHNHFLTALDDGCQSLPESLDCLRVMAENGYNRVFCTPHVGASEFTELTTNQIKAATTKLQAELTGVGLPIALRPGGEIRLSAELPEILRETGIPTYGHNTTYCLVDLWERDWPLWATKAVEWLQKQGLKPILAHPERMPILRYRPEFIADLGRMSLMFQGNLAPLTGVESPEVAALAERFLKDGRYFMLGSDSHRPNTIAARMAGLRRAEELVGKAVVQRLTVINPGSLWM